jgi:Membrane proteins related to metalloendopeptidases
MRVFVLFGFVIFCLNAEAQYPQNYFRNPLNIPISLSANFGELRSNHWHMGLDIRTQQRVNLPVHAAAEGYIARVKIEPGGFGRAIYINHPNGYSTLYAHLNDFFPALEQYVKDQQYKQQTWAIDLPIPANLFVVKKGTFIAYSGTTGGSQGPHLHFEIRDTKTENCLNPLLFGLPVPDAVPPTLTRLAMYDRNESLYMQSPQLFPLMKSNSYSLTAKSNTIVSSSGKISFGLQATDRQSGSNNPNGIYLATIYCDGTPLTSFALNDISYNDTRYINAQIDYRYRKRGGAYLQHLSKLPGDNSDVYEVLQNDGIIMLNDTVLHTIKIEVKDQAANTTVLDFKVRYDSSLNKIYSDAEHDVILIPGNMNVLEKEDFEIVVDERGVYDTVAVDYKRNPAFVEGAVSAAHTIGSKEIPLQTNMIVRIKPLQAIADNEKEKIVIKNINEGDVMKATWQNGWLSASFREFGTFRAYVDSEPPKINSLGKTDTLNLSASKRIVFYPKDNFGISSFRAELDGQWLRFTNDKYSAFIYEFDEKCPYGVHELKVTVKDLVGNETVESWRFKRHPYTPPVRKAVKKKTTKKH